MSEEIMLALIVSADIFLAAVAYRSSDIKIPLLSAFVISSTGAAVLFVSLVLSELISRFVSPEICNIVGFIILTLIGITNIFKSIIRMLIKKLSRIDEKAFKMGSSGIMIKIYLDDTSADFDNSHVLTAYEAFTLSLVTSLDCASTGLSCGFNDISPIFSAIFALTAGFLAILAGTLFGKKISSLNRDFSWLGGLMMILFAIFEFTTS